MSENNYTLITKREEGDIYTHKLTCNGREIKFPFDEISIKQLIYSDMESHTRTMEDNPKINRLEASVSLTE